MESIRANILPEFANAPSEIWDLIISFATMIEGETNIESPRDQDPDHILAFEANKDALSSEWRKSLDTRMAVVLVSRYWYHLGCRYLYHTFIERIENPDPALVTSLKTRELEQFIRTCKKRPDLGQLVRVLVLFTAGNLHSELISLCPNLISFSSNAYWFSKVSFPTSLRSLQFRRHSSREVDVLEEISRVVAPLQSLECLKVATALACPSAGFGHLERLTLPLIRVLAIHIINGSTMPPVKLFPLTPNFPNLVSFAYQVDNIDRETPGDPTTNEVLQNMTLKLFKSNGLRMDGSTTIELLHIQHLHLHFDERSFSMILEIGNSFSFSGNLANIIFTFRRMTVRNDRTIPVEPIFTSTNYPRSLKQIFLRLGGRWYNNQLKNVLALITRNLLPGVDWLSPSEGGNSWQEAQQLLNSFVQNLEKQIEVGGKDWTSF